MNPSSRSHPVRRMASRSGNKRRSAARAGTTGYGIAFRHAGDWRPRGRWRLEVFDRGSRISARVARSPQLSVPVPSTPIIQHRSAPGQTESQDRPANEKARAAGKTVIPRCWFDFLQRATNDQHGLIIHLFPKVQSNISDAHRQFR